MCISATQHCVCRIWTTSSLPPPPCFIQKQQPQNVFKILTVSVSKRSYNKNGIHYFSFYYGRFLFAPRFRICTHNKCTGRMCVLSSIAFAWEICEILKLLFHLYTTVQVHTGMYCIIFTHIYFVVFFLSQKPLNILLRVKWSVILWWSWDRIWPAIEWVFNFF